MFFRGRYEVEVFEMILKGSNNPIWKSHLIKKILGIKKNQKSSNEEAVDKSENRAGYKTEL